MTHPPPTLVIAALPRELLALTRGWQPVPGQPPHVHLRSAGGHLAACAGMGADRVTLALQCALRYMAPVLPARIVSAGLAGACDPALRAGDLLHCDTIIDARSGERFRTADPSVTPGSLLVSVPAVAGVAEKARLAVAYRASLVDMEAATLGRLALAHGIDLLAIKAVSDEATFAVEGLDRFTTPLGQFRERAFALHAAVRPRRWPQLLQLGRNSAAALRALAADLRRELNLPLH